MRIKKFRPDKRNYHEGLSNIEMDDLKQVVAIFGKNGAGKSRLLKILETEVRNKTLTIGRLTTETRELESRLERNGVLSQADHAKLKKGKEELRTLLEEIDYKHQQEQIIQIEPLYHAVDGAEMTEGEYRQRTVHLVTNPRYDEIRKNAIKLLKAFCKSEISHDYYKHNPDKQQYYKHHKEFESENIKTLHLIMDLARSILRKELTYSTDEHLVPILLLDNRQLSLNELSRGELDLLVYCVFMAIQKRDKIPNETVSLKGQTIVIDEPDTFLHPEAQIQLIEGLKDVVGPEGQIWIATHSLTILSVLNRDEIWLMENGTITSPSVETPGKILNSLVGEDKIDRLESFLSSQYEWAAIQFALESLFPPSVNHHKRNDPQQEQVLESLSKPNTKLRILDFGAGTGRIGQELLRHENVATEIYYQPLETNYEFRSRLSEVTKQLQEVSTLEPNKEREILDSYDKLNESQYKEFFDRILLVNVLHELEVNKWAVILNSILHSLKSDGKIIILEDQAIPKGEYAHEYGFLILDVQELKILFSLQNQPENHKSKNPKYSDRLVCAEIPKSSTKITNEIIIQALTRKKSNCKTAIKSLRHKLDKTPGDGRRNSFLTQLYANADMAIQELKGGN